MHNFNTVLAYLEVHPEAPVDATIARIAGTSAYHFRHMFGYLAVISLTQYLRQQRLARANALLVAGRSVLEAALAAGYDSADGFARAYKRWHGIEPSQAASQGWRKTQPPFRFELIIQGGLSMAYRLKTLPAFNLIGVTATVPLQFTGINPAIAALAATITASQRNAMQALADLAPHMVLNADYDTSDFTHEDRPLTHMIGVRSTAATAPAGLTVVPVPAHTWAIFTSKGPFPAALQETWAATASQWLPDSGYELVPAPQLSVVHYNEPADDRTCEIWLAVQPRPNRN
ncbi:AraC family transcriptional regulator [Lacticaseibacillus daqingensis]|uniref:AraC family transcriptional regulator n=1 Tax=Lacticaseibacillus daqingensis TaxID=2486014 RepID=UPI000F78E815|nr:AraC family transcriptional regulator [Lacticaseibacillus daqingensis]